MTLCTIPNINERVVKVYKSWFILIYKYIAIVYSVLAIMEFIKCGHIGFSVVSAVFMLGICHLIGMPYRRQRKAIMKIETFYVVKIKYHSVGTRNAVTYYFDYFGKERKVDAIGGIGYTYNLPKNGSDLIVGMYKTKSGKEKFCCVLPRQVE